MQFFLLTAKFFSAAKFFLTVLLQDRSAVNSTTTELNFGNIFRLTQFHSYLQRRVVSFEDSGTLWDLNSRHHNPMFPLLDKTFWKRCSRAWHLIYVAWKLKLDTCRELQAPSSLEKYEFCVTSPPPVAFILRWFMSLRNVFLNILEMIRRPLESFTASK